MDVVCYDDLDQLGAEIETRADGRSSLDELIQDNYHRLITTHGQNIDDPNFGLGLPKILSGNAADLISAGPRIEGELRKDERNADVRAVVTTLAQGVYDVAIAIVPDPELVDTTQSEVIMQLQSGPNGVRLL